MKRLFLFHLNLFIIFPLYAQTPFSLDSAAAYLKTLSVDIGPRPMGSPNERRAMEFAIKKFKEFGLDEAYIMPVDRVESKISYTLIEIHTGVAIGILKGASNRIILIGGHIDSAGPDIPGANDDGSGSAVVIELARVLSQRKNESTLVFALFGGEERGLLGSKYFVEHFPDIDNVALMLQVDMANGSDWLIPFPDIPEHSAPTWLVKAAYEEFDALGYKGLSYPTHFFTLNSALPGGGVGSDHMSFLKKKIPAIDFTSDMNDPIHTPQDSYENFIVSGLKRSGDLVYKLVERFDSGVPEEKTGQYFLYQIGSTPLFIPLWFLKMFILASFVLALVVFVLIRRCIASAQQPTTGETTIGNAPQKDFSLPGLKLFLIMLIIQTSVRLFVKLVDVFVGARFPWWDYLALYYAVGFVGGLVGIWVALQAAPKLRLSKNPARYFLRAIVLLFIFILLLSLRSVKLAFYPATALFMLSLAMVVQQRFVRIVLWLLSAHFMFHLIFSEGLGLIGRTLSVGPHSLLGFVVLQGIYVLFFSLWSFPFLLGFAAVRLDSGVDYFWLNRLNFFKNQSPTSSENYSYN